MEQSNINSTSLNQNATSLDSWKKEILESFSQWLNELSDETMVTDFQEKNEQPDLFSFFSTLNALHTETKKSSRKTAESLATLSDMLSKIESNTDQLKVPAQDHTLQIISLTDRITRIEQQIKEYPPPGLFFNISHWKKYHKTFTDALKLLTANASDLLKKMHLQKTPTVGFPFDPHTMIAIEVENSSSCADNLVIEEFSAGYSRDGVVVRLAEVKVTRTNI
ncbi:MAG: nucleotide exchange factor GrpE [Fibrobacter sp.]|nr:nucleotide exchange factor GrpE [Fibrobacter sp.]